MIITVKISDVMAATLQQMTCLVHHLTFPQIWLTLSFETLSSPLEFKLKFLKFDYV